MMNESGRIVDPGQKGGPYLLDSYRYPPYHRCYQQPKTPHKAAQNMLLLAARGAHVAAAGASGISLWPCGAPQFSSSAAGSTHPQQSVSSTNQTPCQWLLSPPILHGQLNLCAQHPIVGHQEAHRICSRVKPPGPGGITPLLDVGGAKFAPPNPPGACPCWGPGP